MAGINSGWKTTETTCAMNLTIHGKWRGVCSTLSKTLNLFRVLFLSAPREYSIARGISQLFAALCCSLFPAIAPLIFHHSKAFVYFLLRLGHLIFFSLRGCSPLL